MSNHFHICSFILYIYTNGISRNRGGWAYTSSLDHLKQTESIQDLEKKDKLKAPKDRGRESFKNILAIAKNTVGKNSKEFHYTDPKTQENIIIEKKLHTIKIIKENAINNTVSVVTYKGSQEGVTITTTEDMILDKSKLTPKQLKDKSDFEDQQPKYGSPLEKMVKQEMKKMGRMFERRQKQDTITVSFDEFENSYKDKLTSRIQEAHDARVQHIKDLSLQESTQLDTELEQKLADA